MKIIGDPNLGLRSTGSLDCTYHYYLSGNSVVEEQNGSAQSIKDHVWGLSYIDEAVQTRINTNPTGTASWSSYWLMQDANFNILGIVNSSGVLQERYEYTPYGQRQVFASAGSNDPGCYAPIPMSTRVVTSGSVTQPYGLCEIGHQGLMHDEQTGLVADRARMLAPTIGRFSGEDPNGYVDGGNLYEYLRSCPISLRDPLGTEVGRADRGRGRDSGRDRPGSGGRGRNSSCPPEAPPAPTNKQVCGPDVTAQVQGVLDKLRANFALLPPSSQASACAAFTSMSADPVRSGSKMYLNAWDIEQLHHWSGGQEWINNPPYTPACATSECRDTVSVNGKCYYAGSVNYVLFGTMWSLCGKWESTMDGLINLYKGPIPFYRFPAGNWEASKNWARAGYRGWPASGDPPADRPQCAASCSVPYSGAAFRYYWATTGPAGGGGWQ